MFDTLMPGIVLLVALGLVVLLDRWDRRRHP
jgi:hypothetical protein